MRDFLNRLTIFKLIIYNFFLSCDIALINININFIIDVYESDIKLLSILSVRWNLFERIVCQRECDVLIR